jgi:penicillin V acylase-like amidase (Ntn superfamily)
MCTALTYFDSSSRPYVGRTLEFPVLVPSQLGFVPAGTAFTSQVPGKDPVTWTSKHGFIGVGTPGDVTKPGAPIPPSSLLVFDGMNDAGLVLNCNAYPDTGETPDSGGAGAVLEAADFGTYLLSNFATAAEARTALATQPVNATRIGILGNGPFPLHIMLTDATGQSVTIEGKHGKFHVLDNPVHVMTNAPSFDWHLTNLSNWTHLDNTDHASATFGSLTVSQPDSGIATAALPASNTSVGRFVRSVYYCNFVEKVADPDAAVATLSAIVNNFDRPRGATIDLPGGGGEGMTIPGLTGTSTEYTTNSFLADTTRTRYYVRDYTALNWSVFDLTRLAGNTDLRLIPLANLDPLGGDATDSMVKGANT